MFNRRIYIWFSDDETKKKIEEQILKLFNGAAQKAEFSASPESEIICVDPYITYTFIKIGELRPLKTCYESYIVNPADVWNYECVIYKTTCERAGDSVFVIKNPADCILDLLHPNTTYAQWRDDRNGKN